MQRRNSNVGKEMIRLENSRVQFCPNLKVLTSGQRSQQIIGLCQFLVLNGQFQVKVRVRFIKSVP